MASVRQQDERTEEGQISGWDGSMMAEEVVEIDGVRIRYRSSGSGPVIVFVHGVYVGGTLWDDVVGRLDGYRCVVPTWPLGAHRDAAATADISALATARRIPQLLESLRLEDVTLVGNDTGGGLILGALGTGEPGLRRIGGIVLTNCDSYEHFPPKGFDTMVKVTQKVPPIGQLLLRFFASRLGRRAFLSSVCVKAPKGPHATEIFEAFATSKASRRDALRVTQSLVPSVTLDAVGALRAFDKPVLLAWGDKDKLFPLDHARRLQADFPNARLEVFQGASTYVMLDQPAELAQAIAAFVR